MTPSPLDAHAAGLAALVADYRRGEIPPVDAAHVLRWAGQFPADLRGPLLKELTHVLARTYLSRDRTLSMLDRLLGDRRLTGPDPARFWRGARLLDIQTLGTSQRELVGLFDDRLRRAFGFGRSGTAQGTGPYVYLDDVVMSGNRLKADLAQWLKTEAPEGAHVVVAVLALHRGGQWNVMQSLRDLLAYKHATLSWWRPLELEDRQACTDTADVLRPSRLPADPHVYDEVKELAAAGHPVLLRRRGYESASRLFSGEMGRDMLEQAFLVAGAHIRASSPHWPEVMRPLGFSALATLGFGSLVVTWRNCPNTAPLALWAESPWYPLFPRRPNSDVPAWAIAPPTED